ncbi:MAG: hypothetical protein RLW62_09575 [Gammaproteobacteria bacterium]
MTVSKQDLEAMRRAPTAYFASPREVTARSDLTHADKQAILEAWTRHCEAAAAASRAGRAVQDDPGDRREVERAVELLAELRGS